MTTLEKIKSEIEAVEPKSHVQYGMRWADSTLMIPFHKVLQIIDKYAEQEPTTLQQIIKKHNMANLAYDEMSDFERDILKYAEQEPCEDCDYSEIMEWEQDAKTGKAKPIYWCERHKEPCDKCKYFDGNSCQHYDYKVGYMQGYEDASKNFRQEPISVSVSEKEPDEISEEVTLRFFRNSLKVRWQDMVIYNVEWLKKNWQMEMDIVCGVKPCDDAVSRQAIKKLKRHNLVEGQFVSLYDIEQLPSVRPQEQTGHWINHILSIECSCCGNKLFADDENENCEDYDAIDDLGYKFCPNCGCRMVKPWESEDKG